MFQNSALSMEQAPPIKVVLRFFLTGTLFAFAASFLLFFYGENLENLALPQTLAITHILTLGVMASFMFGALFQMLPVLCGVSIKEPESNSMWINYALSFGTVALVAGFVNNTVILYGIASLLLLFAIFKTAYIMLKELIKIKHSNSSRGMLLSLLSLVLVAVFGLTLLAIRSGVGLNIDYLALKTVHFSFGLFGWVALLVISVSFQVIEMFYVTPAYPRQYAQILPKLLFGLLIANIAMALFMQSYLQIIDAVVILLIALHALLTLIRLKQKKRAVTDATVLFWAFGMGTYLLFTLAYGASYFVAIPVTLLATLFSFFALSVVFAMSYKIVPFLVWFHLNAKGYFEAPMMHEIAHPKYARVNLYLFGSTFIVLFAANFIPVLWKVGAILLFVAFAMLFAMIYKALRKYNYIFKNGKRFEFTIPKSD